ncbi:putative Modin [Fusarium austroafricanum]|uniref:Putative Modin n=1 Tax=Fusarium austroafricanum TaxID=2364996 RepID=A0A8H4KM22_9HYPO|nr:putative Modin [Fusarium austroafricanum]
MLQVKGTVFRMLPNPTIFYWDPSSFSLPTLLTEYMTSLKLLRQQSTSVKESEHIGRIIDWAEKDAKFPLLRAEGSTLDVFGQDINGATLVNGLNHLRAGIELCDEYFGKMKKPSLSLVKKVVRIHIQEIMSILHDKNEKNESDEKKDTDPVVDDDAPININDIDSASGDEKEALLIQMYFDRVRPTVMRIAGKIHSRKLNRVRTDSFASDKITSPINGKAGKENNEDEANEIWCTLVFRMLCWLQLHDFHKMDINISKSDAYASRIPVYIV